MTLTEYFALAHGNQVALAAALGSHQPTVRQWAIGERPIPVVHGAAIERATGGAVTRQELFPDTWSAIWPELAFKVELRAAVASARHVFEGERLAEDVLHYLEQVLAAGAPVPPQTGIAASAAESASVPTGWTDGTGKPLALGPDPVMAAARQAVMHQVRADLAQAADAPVRLTAAQQADISRHQAAIDSAAAAMAAESAKKVADAEWFASRCTTAAPATVDAASAPTTIAHLVVEVDTTQLDAALAKAEQLKVVLAGLAPRAVLS